MNSKDILNESRIIYSLAMILVLYEFYNSEFLKGEKTIFIFIKLSILMLIGTQLMFSLLYGLSLADYKDEKKNDLFDIANLFYAIGFQLVVIFFVMLFFSYLIYFLMYNLSEYFGFLGFIPREWSYILSAIINYFVSIKVLNLRIKYFNWESKISTWIYLIIVYYIFFLSVYLPYFN